jgi:vacuolar-type H+-ATPase subunit H
LDECKDWTDKAAALASYAKQSQDKQLEEMAKRIRARATRRAGELLRQVEPSKGGRPPETKDGGVPSFSRSAAAASAGLSERQAKTAQRLANVPEDDFEEMVESGATVTAIAAAGTERREPNRDEAKRLLAALRAHADRLSALNIDEACAALSTTQQAEVRMLIARLDGYHDKIATSK